VKFLKACTLFTVRNILCFLSIVGIIAAKPGSGNYLLVATSARVQISLIFVLKFTVSNQLIVHGDFW